MDLELIKQKAELSLTDPTKTFALNAREALMLIDLLDEGDRVLEEAYSDLAKEQERVTDLEDEVEKLEEEIAEYREMVEEGEE